MLQIYLTNESFTTIQGIGGEALKCMESFYSYSYTNWLSTSEPHLIVLTCEPHTIKFCGRSVSISDSIP